MFDSLNEEISDLLKELDALGDSIHLYISEDFDLWYRLDEFDNFESFFVYMMHQEKNSASGLFNKAMGIEISFEDLNNWFPLGLLAAWEEFDENRGRKLLRIDNKL